MSSILLFLIETKVGRTIVITIAVIVGVGIGWGVFATKYYNMGHRAAIAEIAAHDRKVLDEVNQAISDVDACNKSNGTWDTTTGVCLKQ